MKRQTGKWNRLSSYKTDVKGDAKPYLTVQYHSTVIVHAVINSIQLDTGGHFTVTTKRKLNQAAHQFDLPYSVHQKKHVWYVTTKAGCYVWDSSDRFTFDRATGIPEGATFAEIGVAIARKAA